MSWRRGRGEGRGEMRVGPVSGFMRTVRPPGSALCRCARIAVILAAGLTLTATTAAATTSDSEPKPVFSGIAQRQTVAPVPRAAWMGAAIMGMVVVVSARRTWRSRHAR